MVGAIGAFSFRDGIATGGQVRSPICRIGNVEHNEQSFPLLVLYRKENTDSGGAGKFRGGNSAAVSFIPHGTSTSPRHRIVGAGSPPRPACSAAIQPAPIPMPSCVTAIFSSGSARRLPETSANCAAPVTRNCGR
jgi:N-methylhydantoinase B